MKRQAMTELQKAVSEAERKAHDMITSERAKMERTVAEAKRQAAEDALAVINQQEDSSEVRPAGCRSGKGFRSEGGSRRGGRGQAEVHVGPETDSCLRGKRVVQGGLALEKSTESRPTFVFVKDLKEHLPQKGF